MAAHDRVPPFYRSSPARRGRRFGGWAVPVVALVGLTSAEMLRTDGAPAGYAGASLDGYATCSGCHNGGVEPGGAGTPFQITSPATSYLPGDPIEITITMDEPGQPYYAPGFQIAAIRDSDHSGSFTLLDADHTQFAPRSDGSDDPNYVTHRAPGSSTRSWTVEWTPGQGVDDVTFFATGLSRYEGVVYHDSLVISRGSGVSIDDEAIPRQAALLQNYPNPFRTTTSIPFDVIAPGSITIYIFDAAGRLVDEFDAGWHLPGRHHVAFSADHLPSGTYFYRLLGRGPSHAMQILR